MDPALTLAYLYYPGHLPGSIVTQTKAFKFAFNDATGKRKLGILCAVFQTCRLECDAREGCKIRILSVPESVGDTEIYDLEFAAKALLASEPHRYGRIENLTVFTGTLILTTGGVSETLNKGDTVRYLADRPDSIKAKNKNARAVLIVTRS